MRLLVKNQSGNDIIQAIQLAPNNIMPKSTKSSLRQVKDPLVQCSQTRKLRGLQKKKKPCQILLKWLMTLTLSSSDGDNDEVESSLKHLFPEHEVSDL